MKKKEVFAKVRFDIETKKTNAYFHADQDWSEHPEYQEMIKLGNYYEATFEEYLLCNNAQQCVIDGVLHACIEEESERLQKLKQAKKATFEKLNQAYYANAERCIINIPFNGRTEYLESLNMSSGVVGLRQALEKIQNDVALSASIDQILPLKYQGIGRMYYIYVSEFSRNYAIDVIIVKRSKRQELINFFQEAIAKYTLEYDNGGVDNYCDFFEEILSNGDVKFGFRQYKEQLDSLSTIEEVQAFTFKFTPLTFTLPEEWIEDVQYNNYD